MVHLFRAQELHNDLLGLPIAIANAQRAEQRGQAYHLWVCCCWTRLLLLHMRAAKVTPNQA